MKGKTEASEASTAVVPASVSRLRLNHLRLLEMLVEHGTVRKAAERLHLSQPAVSQMLKDIESAFGGRLFSRTRKGVLPNERLSPLLRRVRIMLGELDAAQRELTTLALPTLRVGANLQFLAQHVPAALSRVWGRNRELHFILCEGSTRVLIDSLLKGDLDCAIGPMRGLRPSQLKELKFWPLYPSDLCLVVNPSHPLARRKRVNLADLARELWALGAPGGQARQTIDEAFVRAGLHPPVPVLECRPHFLNIHLVKQTPFVTVATRADALSAEKAGMVRILPIELALNYGPIAFICRKESSQDTFLMQFREEMVASARPSHRRGARR